MLPLLLQCDIDAAANALRLPPAAVQALRGHGGPWQPYLHLLRLLEAADLPALEVAAAAFGGSERVMAQWAQAWHQA